MVSQLHFLPSSWLFAKPSFKVTTAAYLTCAQNCCSGLLCGMIVVGDSKTLVAWAEKKALT